MAGTSFRNKVLIVLTVVVVGPAATDILYITVICEGGCP